MKKILFTLSILVLGVGSALAQDTISVPPDPGDGPSGGCICPSACGWWSCFIGTCSANCAVGKMPVVVQPNPIMSKLVLYTPVSLLIHPATCSSSQPPTNQTFPDPPTPGEPEEQVKTVTK